MAVYFHKKVKALERVANKAGDWKEKGVAKMTAFKMRMPKMLGIKCLQFLLVVTVWIFSAEITLAETTPIPLASSTQDGGSDEVIVSGLPTSVSGDVDVLFDFIGDLCCETATVVEEIQVSFDNVVVGTIGPTGGGDCQRTTQSLVVPQNVIAPLITDGQIVVRYDANPEVNINCNTTALGGPSNATFAVLGTLTYTGDESVSEEDIDTGESTMMANRGTMIMANTVDKQRRIDRLRNGSGVTREAVSLAGIPVVSDMPVGIGLDENRLNFVAGADWGNSIIWVEGRIAKLDDDITNDAHFGILHFGVDWLLTSDMLIGLSAQIDTFEQYDIASDTDFSGLGWMVGPIVTARVAPNLYFNGRLAYGHADNDAKRTGGKDNFDSERALAEISLTGEMTQGAYSIFPTAQLSYFWEQSDAYTSATYGPIAAAEVALGQARLGARVERPFELTPGQSAKGFVDLSAVYTNRYEGTLTTGSFAEEIEGWSGEAEVGMSFATKSGIIMAASVGAGGLLADADTYSAMLSVNIPLK